MKSLLYIFLGFVIGAIAGVFFGAIFGIAVTKKSEIGITQQIQMPVFGILGAFLGAYCGYKISEEK